MSFRRHTSAYTIFTPGPPLVPHPLPKKGLYPRLPIADQNLNLFVIYEPFKLPPHLRPTLVDKKSQGYQGAFPSLGCQHHPHISPPCISSAATLKPHLHGVSHQVTKPPALGGYLAEGKDFTEVPVDSSIGGYLRTHLVARFPGRLPKRSKHRKPCGQPQSSRRKTSP